MSKALSVGDTVQCRLFNTPDGEFYGDFFVGNITKIDSDYKWNNSVYEVAYFVESESRPFGIWVKRKEIKRRID